MKPRLLFAGCVCCVIAFRSLFALENPQLSLSPVTNTTGQFEIFWPASASNWVLESSLVLPSLAAWNCLMPESYETRGSNRVVRVTAGAENRFYRLRRLTPAVPGLTGLWQLDEGAGQTGGDGSGSGAPLSMSGVTWGSGRFGMGSLQFNGGAAGSGGSRAWVSNQNYTVLLGGGAPFSVSLWLNPDAVSAGSRGLMGNTPSAGTNGWQVTLQTPGVGTNYLIFSAPGGGGFLSVTGRTLLLPGRWHQLAVTYNGEEGRVYLDGELLGASSGAMEPFEGPIYFGGGVGGLNSFLGRLDEIRTFTNCLSAEEISLTGRWHLDEGCGDFLADTSLQGHHASVTDATSWVEGHEGRGIDLNCGRVIIGNTDYAVLPRTGEPFSISFWIRPASQASDRSGLMSCGVGNQDGWQLALQRDELNGSRLQMTSTNSGGTLDLWVPAVLDAGVWSKVDVTFNGGMATLYENGRKLGSGQGAIRATQGTLTVGMAPGATAFNGAFDELKIYNRERGESEIGPVAPAIWETVFVNGTTNLALPGSGPAGRTLTYSIVPLIVPTNGLVSNAGGSGVAVYQAGSRKGPDAFTYTVSDGEFTSAPAIAVVSVVEPHWLSTTGGVGQVLDGSSPSKAWPAAAAAALDAIWKTNNFYDCFLYGPGVYETHGWKYGERSTANPGCKHVGAGSAGGMATTVRLVDIWSSRGEETIFTPLVGELCDGFEVRHMVLDCNGEGVPKYTRGEPVWIRVPLQASGWVSNVTLRWASKVIPGTYPPLQLGRAVEFSICAIQAGTNVFLTNCVAVLGTGQVSVVNLGVPADEIRVQLDRRIAGADFYGLSEFEISGATTCLPVATVPGGGESRLDAAHSIVQAVDSSFGTSWASGPESQARLEFPLPPGTLLSQVNLRWNCKSISGVGRLGAAAGYLIRAWDDAGGQYHDIPFVSHGRAASGLESVSFGTLQQTNTVVTSKLQVLLTNREPGVTYYSLREVTFQNGNADVPVPVPSSLNSSGYGDFSILRAFDRDLATEWASGTQGAVGAITVSGNNLKFMDLKIVGFGTKAGRESFPLYLSPPMSSVPTRVGNILVEDCIVTEPALHNVDGVSAIALLGNATVPLTNGIVRRCVVSGLKPYFTYSHGVGAVVMENCVVSNCNHGVYFEPDSNPYTGGDDYGPVLIRSNQMVDVDIAIYVATRAGATMESMAIVGNELVLSGANGWGFLICDTCAAGPNSTTTNVVVLNNVIRFAGWAPRPANGDSGLYYSDIQHAVYGNNVIALGTFAGLRVRACPSGLIPAEDPVEDCDHPLILQTPPPSYPPCLDALRPGYRRAWFGNRDLSGTLLPVRFYNNGLEGLSSQQQTSD